MTKITAALFSCFCLMVSPFARAGTVSHDVLTVAGAEIQVAEVFRATHSIEGVGALLSFLHASSDAVDAIQSDLKALNHDRDNLSNTTVVNGRVLVDGKETGIKIVSYQPLNVTYQGRLWSGSAHQSIDQTYFALKKFLSAPKSQALLSFFINPAYAEFSTGKSGATHGAAIGAGVGAIASAGVLASLTLAAALGSAVTIPFTLAVLLCVVGGAAIGALIGYLTGKQIGKEELEIAKKLLQQRPRFSCDSSSFTIALGEGNDYRKMVFKRSDDSYPSPQILDASGREVANRKIAGWQTATLSRLFESCKSQADAGKKQAEFEDDINAANNTHVKVSPRSAI